MNQNKQTIQSVLVVITILLLFSASIKAQTANPMEIESPRVPQEKEKPFAEDEPFLKKLIRQSSFTILAGRNGGDNIFETGTKYANLSGLRGGSRITYERDFNYGGLGFTLRWKKWEADLNVKTTGRYVNAGEGRDEDFYLGDPTIERGTKISTREFSYYDTPYTFIGSRNFADGKGRLSMKQDRQSLILRRYFGDSDPDARKEGKGLFLTGGFQYTFMKYVLYDVFQYFDANPVFLNRIGLGLSLSYSTYEFPLGLGYRYSNAEWIFETSFSGVFWSGHFRDFHYQRALNFIGDVGGFGIDFNVSAGRIFGNYLVFLKLNEHRLFGDGHFQTKGGLSQNDILSQHLGQYKNYMNLKEWNVELSLMGFLY
ncbi:putative porin [Leptospira yasudae]|uniref:Putative porin n=1 Tax=Leptospira yasudae TaxID=2202201 RepID=A0A6N4QQ84_9LEPT|nr:putative porin [Leptospira yasudae]TGL79594.1 putative porin [Leptospira yasudae]TGL81380.1 putative porin [Leptospira yasudae]TGL81776.1 putative porin [Leptospira yasudae]